MKNYLIPILIFVFLNVAGGAVWAETPEMTTEEKEEFSVDVSKKWLKQNDKRKYDKTWETAAQMFKNVITQEQWEKIMQAIRNPLGKVKSREVLHAKYTTELPGAPDGEYVVIQFNTEFENKESSIETITAMLDQDAEWRISGYFIR